MKWLKYTILFFFAGFLTLLDTSFFANITAKGATIISVFQFILILALLGNTKNYFVFISGAIVFFAIFSSLPVWIIFLLLFILPSTVLYLSKDHLSLLSVPIAAILFLVANFLFELILLLYMKEWNKNGFEVMYYFVILNSIFGIFEYYLFHLFLQKSKKGGRIKSI